MFVNSVCLFCLCVYRSFFSTYSASGRSIQLVRGKQVLNAVAL